jgi:hypothetical protein
MTATTKQQPKKTSQPRKKTAQPKVHAKKTTKAKTRRRSTAATQGQPQVAPKDWQFKLTFASVLFLTVLSLGISLALVYHPAQSEEGKRLFETCSTTWKMGFGAIVGLIGGKTMRK